jgi:hypothetical protein
VTCRGFRKWEVVAAVLVLENPVVWTCLAGRLLPSCGWIDWVLSFEYADKRAWRKVGRTKYGVGYTWVGTRQLTSRAVNEMWLKGYLADTLALIVFLLALAYARHPSPSNAYVDGPDFSGVRESDCHQVTYI